MDWLPALFDGWGSLGRIVEQHDVSPRELRERVHGDPSPHA